MELTKEDILKAIDSGTLCRQIANAIIDKKTDANWNEFDAELLKGLELAVKEIVETYIKEYYDGEQIHSKIREELSKLTKAEIITILSE